MVSFLRLKEHNTLIWLLVLVQLPIIALGLVGLVEDGGVDHVEVEAGLVEVEFGQVEVEAVHSCVHDMYTRS